MMSLNLMEYFNRQQRIGTLSTAGNDGKVDSAVFGSPYMTDEKTVLMGSGNNRTLANLKENPYAMYMIMEPGTTIMDWKGIRVYLKVKKVEESGPMIDVFKSRVVKLMGEDAAAMIHAAVSFDISEVRPLIDYGQGWEKSI